MDPSKFRMAQTLGRCAVLPPITELEAPTQDNLFWKKESKTYLLVLMAPKRPSRTVRTFMAHSLVPTGSVVVPIALSQLLICASTSSLYLINGSDRRQGKLSMIRFVMDHDALTRVPIKLSSALRYFLRHTACGQTRSRCFQETSRLSTQR